MQELGDRYGELLDGHRRALRSAFQRHAGVEVDTQGDAFFYAFSKATDAVAAALEGQEALGDGDGANFSKLVFPGIYDIAGTPH